MTPPGTRWLRTDWLAAMAAVLLAIGVYASSVGFQFAYDDVHIIVDSQRLHSLANWREILTSTWWADAVYRPLTALSLAVDWTISGGAPAWFHAVNVLLHAAATLLVFILARRLLRPFGAALAAMLFAVHPVHVEAVANVVGRAEVLATAFALLAVLAYWADGRLADASDRSWRRWMTSFGTLLALGAGLASKETAFVTPGLLLLVDWHDGRRSGAGWEPMIRRHWVLWVASVALTAEWLWIWLDVVGRLAGGEPAPGLMGAGLLERVVVMAPVVVEYVRLLVVPARLSMDYSPNFLPVTHELTPRALLGFAIVVAGVWGALAARKRAPAMTLALGWLGGSLLIVSNILVPTEILLGERTLYLASVGAVLALAMSGQWIASRRPAVAAVVGGLVVGLGLVRAVTRVPVWRSNATVFPQLVEDAPGSYRSYWVAGMLAYQQGDSTRGETLVRQAIQIYPLNPTVWSDLATQLEHERRYREAATFFSAAFRIEPSRGDYAALAMADYMRAGMFDSAKAVSARAEPSAGDRREYQLARADLDLAEGHPARGMIRRRRVALASPDVPVYWELTADAALRAGYCWEANRSVARVRSLDSNRPSLAELSQRLAMAGC